MFKIQIPNWIIAAMLILFGLLILSLIRGCNNQHEASIAQINYQNRINKLIEDSAAAAMSASNYFDTTEFLNGQLELSNNKISSLTENLDSADKRIATLLKKHVPIEPNPDTTVTLVPNKYIEECSDCFTELSNGRQEVLKYKSERDTQEQLYKDQLMTRNKRISFLENYTTKLSKDYKSLIDSAKNQNKLEQRRTLFFKLGALAIKQSFPNSAGAGLIYQDKMKRLFSIGYYISPQGSIYQAEIAFPLSLKKL